MAAVGDRARSCVVERGHARRSCVVMRGRAWSCAAAVRGRGGRAWSSLTAVLPASRPALPWRTEGRTHTGRTTYNTPLNPPGVGWVKFCYPINVIVSIRTCVPNLGSIRGLVRKNCLLSLIIDNHNIWYGSYAEKKYWTRKKMISTGLPYLQFSMNSQGFSPARLTWPAYDGGRKRKNSSAWKHRIIVASTCRRSVEFGRYVTWLWMANCVSVMTKNAAFV